MEKNPKETPNCFQKGLHFCEDRDGNLVQIKSISENMERTFLKIIGTRDDNVTEELIMNGCVDCHTTELDDARTAYSRLTNYNSAGADGLQAVLSKTGGDELIRRLRARLLQS